MSFEVYSSPVPPEDTGKVEYEREMRRNATWTDRRSVIQRANKLCYNGVRLGNVAMHSDDLTATAMHLACVVVTSRIVCPGFCGNATDVELRHRALWTGDEQGSCWLVLRSAASWKHFPHMEEKRRGSRATSSKAHAGRLHLYRRIHYMLSFRISGNGMSNVV